MTTGSSQDAAGGLVGGRYALGALLGVGGSASVFAADDTSSGERVAVKLLHPHLCADDATRAAFLAEEERVAALDDPHIVRVRGAGLHDAGGVVMPWIALDLATGPTLRECVAQDGPLTPAVAAAVARDVLAGLAAAHAAGIVHRDISPQNIVLDDEGAAFTARILDFGLADVTGRSTVGGDILLARDGVGAQVVGNAHYMSPEQAQGLPVRAASDLYQLGAVLYFALTGQPPFPRPTTAQVLEAHLGAPPPVPSVLVPAARPLDRVVTRALTKTPARRFRDAAEFAAAIEAALPAAAPADVASFVSPLAPGEADGLTAATRILPEQRVGTLDYLSPVPAASEPAPRARTGGGIAAAATAVAVVVGLGVWAGMAAAGGATAGPAPSPSATVEAPPAPVVSETPTTAPTHSAPPPDPAPTTAPATVPGLFGTIADAERALAAAGLALGALSRVESPEAADRVLSQNPAAGAQLAPGSAVDVTLASGYNTVPTVTGLDSATAAALLESAGFAVAGRPTGTAAASVTGTNPASGTVLRVGVTVTLRLSPASTPSPGATPGATPGGGVS